MEDKEKSEFEEAFKIWDDFKEQVKFNNRFFIQSEVLNLVDKIIVRKNIILNEGTKLYRARIFEDDIKKVKSFIDIYKSKEEREFNKENQLYFFFLQSGLKIDITNGYWGYNEKESFVPTDRLLVSAGRLNPSQIVYLYSSEDELTALSEVRPNIGTIVSIGELKLSSSKEIIDFTFNEFGKFTGIEKYLLYLINSDFSNPVSRNINDYIPTQIIAEYVKSKNYHGIRFQSSVFQGGKNIVLFNYEDCKVVSSKLIEIKDVCYESRSLYPDDNKNYSHPKLKPYFKERLHNFLDSLKRTKEK